MSRGDLAYVIIILTFAIVAFLPWARRVQFVGVAGVGWLMALLMLLSPVIAILRILHQRRRRSTSPGQPAEREAGE